MQEYTIALISTLFSMLDSLLFSQFPLLIVSVDMESVIMLLPWPPKNLATLLCVNRVYIIWLKMSSMMMMMMCV